MSRKNIGIIITFISAYIYIGGLLKFKHAPDGLQVLTGIVFFVGLIAGYPYLLLRDVKKQFKEISAKLNGRFSMFYYGVSYFTNCVVANDNSGVIILELTGDGKQVTNITRIPYSDLEMGASPAISMNSDRGVGVVIRRKSDNWQFEAGLMPPEDILKLSVLSYYRSRLSRTASDANPIIKQLSTPTNQSVDTSDIDASTATGGKQRSTTASFSLIALSTFLGVALSLGLVLLTAAITDEELRRELTAPITTCQRDASHITALPVNKTIDAVKGKVTIHQIVYNVPQTSKHPAGTSRGHQCEKATFVEVTIEPAKPVSSKLSDRFRTEDLQIMTTTNGSAGIFPSTSDYKQVQFKNYIQAHKLNMIDSYQAQYSQETQKGWLLYAIQEDKSTYPTRIVFDEYGENISVPLPRENN
ncbi:hypothetical protein BH09PAT4_BH09PAT4_00260 [soil metagenome]